MYNQYTYQRWIIRSWSDENNLKVEYFWQKNLQRLTWQRELELFIQYLDWPLPVSTEIVLLKPDEDWPVEIL